MFTWTIRPLGPDTRDAFLTLAAEHGGGHPHGEHGARAALVLDPDGTCLGWAQYGTPDEVPVVKHRRVYDAHADESPTPDWRICCVYVGAHYRRLGVARAAVEGALQQIAEEGGGVIEAISQVTEDREVASRTLPTATVELFERHGFTRGRQVGPHAFVVSRRI